MSQRVPLWAIYGVDVPPPPSRFEGVPAPRVGFTWIPGYWDWVNGRYVWVVGQWIPERRGYHWLRHHWLLRDGRWYMQPGGWAADAPGASQRNATPTRVP